MKWREWLTPWRRSGVRNTTYSVGDPSLAGLFSIVPNFAGVDVNESSALSVSAVYRSVALIAGTIGTLPMRTLRDTGDGMRQRIGSFLDNPGGPYGPIPMVWKETAVAHLLLHGDAFAKHLYGGAGQLVGLQLIHPLLVAVEPPCADEYPQPVGGKWFVLTLPNGAQERHDATTMTHIMGLSLDGWRGMSVITAARNGLGIALAGDRASARMFSNGALMAGMVTPDEDVDEEEAKAIKAAIDTHATGWEHNAAIPVFNRRLKFTPWTMNATDAQFLESRQFSVREVARWFGVPPHLLMETSAASNWGTGIEQQNLGLSRFTLTPWTVRVEETLSRLLPNPRFVEFDFAGLERGSPAEEIQLLISQVQAGILTVDEARSIRNLPPLEPGPTPAQQALPQGAPA